MSNDTNETLHFLEANHDKLVHYVTRAIKNMPLAEDIVHDVYLKIFELQPTFKDDKHRKNYIYRALRNQTITALAAERRSIPFSDDWFDEIRAYAEDSELSFDTIDWLTKTLKDRPPEVRDAFIRHALYSARIKELAEELNMDPATLRQHFHRIKIKLVRSYLLLAEIISIIRILSLVT